MNGIGPMLASIYMPWSDRNFDPPCQPIVKGIQITAQKFGAKIGASQLAEIISLLANRKRDLNSWRQNQVAN